MAAPRIEKLNNIGFAWYRNKVRALNDTQSEDEMVYYIFVLFCTNVLDLY